MTRINATGKKAQMYLAGGFMLFIVLSLFIVSHIYRNIIIVPDYMPQNIASEFQRSLNALFIENNSITYINSGLDDYSLLIGNFTKSKAYGLRAYYVVVMPNVSVIFGNYFNETIANVSISVNNETLSQSMPPRTSQVFYFNASGSDILNLTYSFFADSKTFEKNKTIQNTMFYVHWIKLTTANDVIIKEVVE